MMKYHVHPETYELTDPIEIRRVQLHKRKWQCEMTHCTFADHYEWAKEPYVRMARELRAELRKHPELEEMST